MSNRLVADQFQQWHCDGIAGRRRAPPIHRDTRDELAMSGREPVLQRPQLRVIAGYIDCSTAAMREPEHGHPVGSDIGPSRK